MFDFPKQKLFKHILYPIARLHWRVFSPKTCGARALLIHQNNILLVRNLNLPYWTIPGGGIEKGETAEKCLARELFEELNISIGSVEYKLGEYTSELEGKRDEIHIFVINPPSSEFTKQWELAEARWFPLENLPEDISPATLRRINEFKQGSKDLVGVW